MKIEILARKHDGIVITHYPSGYETDISKATFIKDTFDDIELTIDKVRSWLILEKIGVVIPEDIRKIVGILFKSKFLHEFSHEELRTMWGFVSDNLGMPNSIPDFINVLKAINVSDQSNSPNNTTNTGGM